jgi:hypothetical protein
MSEHQNIPSEAGNITIGLDVGDRMSRYCILGRAGEILLEAKAATTIAGIRKAFGDTMSSRIALEVGTHSPWIRSGTGQHGASSGCG